MRQESITATPMLSVTTLKALTIVHANQNLQETVLTAQVNNKAAVQPSAEAGESADKKRAIKR